MHVQPLSHVYLFKYSFRPVAPTWCEMIQPRISGTKKPNKD